MKGIKRLYSALGFDKSDDRFELTETERGVPKRWSGWVEGKDESRHQKTKLRVSHSLDKNERRIKELFGNDRNKDLILRRFRLKNGLDALIVYMNGMAKDTVISDFIMRPLMGAEAEGGGMETLISEVLQISELDTTHDLGEIEKAVLDGKTALLLDGARTAAVLETRGYEKRDVSLAENERIVKGPKEGFTENLRTNITLLRRIIRTDDLIAKLDFSPGMNNTGLALVYRNKITNERLLNEIVARLEKVDMRFLASTGVLEQLIEDDALSPLPQTLSTERPDRVASFVMQGAVAVLADGSPIALVLPATLSALMSSPEDAYMRRTLGAIMRFIRYFGALLSIFLPGYFVALAMYHQGLLSTEVLSTIIKSREMVFEPLPFEMILLLFVFQLIREAGMRVPGSVGQAIGVIGGLILGQAAVSANLASTVILIIVALSGLGNLCIPDYSTQIAASYFRMAFVLAGWLGGLLAYNAAVMLLIAYTANLKSFGVPFLAPFAPKTYSKRPTVLRGNIGMHTRADDYLNTENKF